jgi:hypothetical protein
MNPFQPVRGVEIPSAHLLRQGHEVTPYHDMCLVRANVSAEHLDALFRRAVALMHAPLCLILELPCHESRERELRSSSVDPFHRDVYYIDNLSHEEVLGIYERYCELLVHDGMVYYGVGSQEGEEIFVASYKLVSIYTRQYAALENVLAELDIPKVDSAKRGRAIFHFCSSSVD